MFQTNSTNTTPAMIHQEWQGKSTDYLLFLGYFALILCIFVFIYHVFPTALLPYLRNEENTVATVLTYFAFVIFTTGIVYLGSQPKRVQIDQEANRLYLLSRFSSRIRKYDLQHITYFHYSNFWFTSVEINADFVNSRGRKLNLKVGSILALNVGFSWTKKDLDEIDFYFKSIDIPSKKVYRIRSFYDNIVS